MADLTLQPRHLARQITANVVILLAYAAVVAFIMSRHEPWRDEVHTLNSVTESASFADLFRQIRNEGHPALWHSIVYAFYQVWPHSVSLKLASFAVAVLAASVLLFSSPFTIPEKILFLFGFYPIYEYSVVSRNYGISMLLFFILLAQVCRQKPRFLWAAWTVFLMANTNAHSCVLAIAYLSARLQSVRQPALRGSGAATKQTAVAETMIIAAGIAAALFQMRVDPNSSVKGLAGWHAIGSPLSVPADPSSGRQEYFYQFLRATLAMCVIVPALYSVSFIRRNRPAFIFLYLSIIGLALFFLLIFNAAIRHWGFFYLLAVGGLWMERSEYPWGVQTAETKIAAPWSRALKRSVPPLLWLLMCAQLYLGARSAVSDVRHDFSSSRGLAALIKNRADLRDAVLIGEPDTFMESIPYYTDNLIYIPREDRWGKNVRLTSANKTQLSLGELLSAARRIRSERRVPVLIALGYRLERDGPYVLPTYYGKTFVYSRSDLDAFYKAVRPLAEFRMSGKEDYDVFELPLSKEVPE